MSMVDDRRIEDLERLTRSLTIRVDRMEHHVADGSFPSPRAGPIATRPSRQPPPLIVTAFQPSGIENGNAVLDLTVRQPKVFLYDLSTLDSVYRIASFIALGLLLLAGAYAYQRLRPPPPPDLRTAPPALR